MKAVAATGWIFVRGKFALLRRLLSGNFTIEDFFQNILIGLGSDYFGLPPKPGGEPVIAAPTIMPELLFEIEAYESESITEPQTDYDLEASEMDETSILGKKTSTTLRQRRVQNPNNCPSFDGALSPLSRQRHFCA
jgi:hypothetical protein